MENGKRNMENERWEMVNVRWKMVNVRWEMVNVRWKMVNELDRATEQPISEHGLLTIKKTFKETLYGS